MRWLVMTRSPPSLNISSRLVLLDGRQGARYRFPFFTLLNQDPNHPPLRIDVVAIASLTLEDPAVGEDRSIPINAAYLDLIAVAFELTGLRRGDSLEQLGSRSHRAIGLYLEHVVAKESL